MNILFLSRWFPYPVDNGSKLRITGLLRGLAKHHTVTLVSFADRPNAQLNAPELQSICSTIHVIPWREFNPKSWRARFGLFSLQPRFLIDTHSNEMAYILRQLIADQKFDLIIASQLSMAAYYPYFRGTPAIFEELELGQFYGKIASTAGLLKRLRVYLTWFKLSLYLRRLFGAFRICTVVSEQELNLFVKNFPSHKKKAVIIPNCIQFDDYQEIKAQTVSKQLVYSGSFLFYANYEAMLWFVRHVFPKILEQLPDVQLLITGDHANMPLPSLQNVILSGYVADIKTVIASSAVSLAPLFSGGGTRLKILEAMALGTPVVSTSKGAEGLGVVVNEHLLIADTPDNFADQVINLLSDPDLYARLSSSGKQFVKEKYNWETTIPQFLKIAESVIK